MAKADIKLAVDLFRRIASELESLSDDDVLQLLARRGSLFDFPKKEKSVVSARGHSALSEGALAELRMSLSQLNSREEGEALLSGRIENRSQLLQLARSIDIPVSNKHNIEQILGKIVEATIGYRIRSAAIRGPESGTQRNQSNLPSSDTPES